MEIDIQIKILKYKFLYLNDLKSIGYKFLLIDTCRTLQPKRTTDFP